MAMAVESAPGCGGTVTEIAGFGVPFHVWTSGTHHLTASWDLNFSAFSSGHRFRCKVIHGSRRCVGATAHLSVVAEMIVFDRATGALVPTGPRKYSEAQVVLEHGSRGNYTENFAFRLTTRMIVAAGAQYEVKTWIRAEVLVYGLGSPSSPDLASASFDMAAPGYVGALTAITLQ